MSQGETQDRGTPADGNADRSLLAGAIEYQMSFRLRRSFKSASTRSSRSSLRFFGLVALSRPAHTGFAVAMEERAISRVMSMSNRAKACEFKPRRPTSDDHRVDASRRMSTHFVQPLISTLRFLPNALAYFWIVDKRMSSA